MKTKTNLNSLNAIVLLWEVTQKKYYPMPLMNLIQILLLLVQEEWLALEG